MVTWIQANKSYAFVGAQTSLVNYEEISSSTSVGLKYGVQKGMWRTSFNLDYSGLDENRLNSLILQIDRGLFEESTKNLFVKPHIGFSLGVLEHKFKQTDKGYGLGTNAGLTFILNDAFDLDLNYRYLSTSKMSNIGSVQHINLSLHYFY